MFQEFISKTERGADMKTSRSRPLLMAVLFFAAFESSDAEEAHTVRAIPQGPAEQTAAPISRDAFNRPCLQIEGIARPHVVNPSILDHVVSVKNNCPKRVNVKVCYFDTDRCKPLAIGAYGREDTILGTLSGIKYFRYSVIEQR